MCARKVGGLMRMEKLDNITESNNIIIVYTVYSSNESIQNCWSANRDKLLYIFFVYFFVCRCLYIFS